MNCREVAGARYKGAPRVPERGSRCPNLKPPAEPRSRIPGGVPAQYLSANSAVDSVPSATSSVSSITEADCGSTRTAGSKGERGFPQAGGTRYESSTNDCAAGAVASMLVGCDGFKEPPETENVLPVIVEEEVTNTTWVWNCRWRS